MLSLPVEYPSLVLSLVSCIHSAHAGVLTTEDGDDPQVLMAALDEASARAGTPVRRAWIGHDQEMLAWLREDDIRLQLMPALRIVGVALRP